MSQRGTSCANLYAAAVQHDKAKGAFTLAEVLITLVIIGIIAALTIPNLLQKYQEQATVKKVQRFYSTLSNAYALVIKDKGPSEDWCGTGMNRNNAIKIYEILFKPYFKIAKDCGITNNGNCISNEGYKHFSNNASQNYGTSRNYYKIALEDGAAIFWRGITNSTNVYVFYDTNGAKEPNQFGRDLFVFFIKNDKVFPQGIQSGPYSNEPFNTYCKRTSNGGGCAAWVVYKGNMDYLHCDGLTWDSHSCKEK